MDGDAVVGGVVVVQYDAVVAEDAAEDDIADDLKVGLREDCGLIDGDHEKGAVGGKNSYLMLVVVVHLHDYCSDLADNDLACFAKYHQEDGQIVNS